MTETMAIDVGQRCGVAFFEGDELVRTATYELEHIPLSVRTRILVHEVPHFRQQYAKGLYNMGIMTGQAIRSIAHETLQSVTRREISQRLKLPYKYTKHDSAERILSLYPHVRTGSDHEVDAIIVGLAYLDRVGTIDLKEAFLNLVAS